MPQTYLIIFTEYRNGTEPSDRNGSGLIKSAVSSDPSDQSTVDMCGLAVTKRAFGHVWEPLWIYRAFEHDVEKPYDFIRCLIMIFRKPMISYSF